MRTASSARSSAVWAILSCSWADLTCPSASLSSGASVARASGERIGRTTKIGWPCSTWDPGSGTSASGGRLDRPQERRGDADQPTRRDHRLAAVADRPRHRLPLRLDDHDPQPLLGLLGQLQLGQVRLLHRAGHLRRRRRLRVRVRIRLRRGGRRLAARDQPAGHRHRPGRRDPRSPDRIREAPARPLVLSIHWRMPRRGRAATRRGISEARTGDRGSQGPRSLDSNPRSIMTNPAVSRTARTPYMSGNLEYDRRPSTELSQSPCRQPASLDDKPGKLVMPGKGPGSAVGLACSDVPPRPVAPSDRREYSHGWDFPDSDRAGGLAAGVIGISAAPRPAAMIRSTYDPAPPRPIAGMHRTRHRRRSAASAAPGVPAPVPPRPARVLPRHRRPASSPTRRQIAGSVHPSCRPRGGPSRSRRSRRRRGRRRRIGAGSHPRRADDEAPDDGERERPASGGRGRSGRASAGRRRVAASDAGRRPGHDGGPAAGRSRGPADPRPGDAAGRQCQRAGRPVDHPATGPLRRPDQQPRPGGAAPGEPAGASAEAVEVARRFPVTLNPTVWVDYRPITLIPPGTFGTRRARAASTGWPRRQLLPLRPELHPVLDPAADRAGAPDDPPLPHRQGRL